MAVLDSFSQLDRARVISLWQKAAGDCPVGLRAGVADFSLFRHQYDCTACNRGSADRDTLFREDLTRLSNRCLEVAAK